MTNLDTFVPPRSAGPARHQFVGTLAIDGGALALEPRDTRTWVPMPGRSDRFPAVRIPFVTVDGDLVPVDRGILGARDGVSYWSLMAGVGRVWADPADGGRSRAAIPFALMHPLENDSHHGLATFTYDDTSVGDVTLRVVQRTAPFLVSNGFGAAGVAPARREPLDGAGVAHETIVNRHRAERRGRFPVRPWNELATRCDLALLGAVAGAHGAGAIVHALDVDGTLYAEPCRADGGVFPYPETMACGVWSVTKSAATMVAALRLARTVGDHVLDVRVRDVFAGAARHDGWRDVTLAHCLDMATGIGGTAGPPGPAMEADYATEFWHDAHGAAAYRVWYLAESRDDKLAAAFACPAMPWGPGVHARYRDQDLFMAGAMIAELHRRHDGRAPGLWDAMLDEVYRPIGIAHLTTTHTLGPDPVPLGAFGLFLTLDAAAKIARLLHDGGRRGAEQVLSAVRTAEALGRAGLAPRLTGRTSAAGAIGYRSTFWFHPFRARDGVIHRIPTMNGYGGNVVALFPNGMTGLRFAHDIGGDERWSLDGLAHVAEAIRPFPTPHV